MLFYILLLLLPCLERIIPEPVLYLPMDVIDGNKIQGSIDGTVRNGASLVAGKIDNAIFTNGISQYLDYGMHESECFYNQDACAKGVTFALWFKAHSDVVTFTAIDTGATSRNSRGVYLRYFKTRDLKISIKWDQKYDYYKVPGVPPLTWIHVAFTWDRQSGIRGFINGCDADATGSKGYAWRAPRNDAIRRTYKFTVGAGIDGSFEPGEMSLDELMAWNSVLEPAEIWQLFIQGGTMGPIS